MKPAVELQRSAAVTAAHQQYSVQALMLLAQVTVTLLDVVYRSEEKERVIPLLSNILYNVFPYLKNHRYVATTRVLSQQRDYALYFMSCLLYTSDAADDLLCVDLGGLCLLVSKNDACVHGPWVSCVPSITVIYLPSVPRVCWRAVPLVLTCCLDIGPNRNSIEPCSGAAVMQQVDVVWLLIGVVAVSLGTEITTTTDVQEDRSSSHCVDTAHASVGTYYIVRPRLCSLCELTTPDRITHQSVSPIHSCPKTHLHVSQSV